MAHISKLPKNARTGQTRYKARWRTASGAERSQVFPRRIDAERFLAGVEADKAKGSYVDPGLGKMTLGEWFAKWRPRQTHLKPSSELAVDSLWRTQLGPAFESWPLSGIGFGEASDWLASMTRSGLSASRTRQAYHLLTGMLDDAVKEGRLARNAARGVALPKLPPGRMTCLTWDELEALANACGHYRLLVLLLGCTGMRIGEVRAADVKDFDPESKRIYVRQSKTGKARWVPVRPDLANELAQLCKTRGQDEPLLTSSKGARISVTNWRRRTNAFDDARVTIGYPDLVPHDLRHTAASLAIATGANVKAIQQMLGHASAAMTLDRYGHLFDEQLDAVGEAMGEAAQLAREAREKREAEEADAVALLKPPASVSRPTRLEGDDFDLSPEVD